MGIEIPETGWVLPDNLRDELTIPPGPVISGDKLPESVSDHEKLVTVGDRCTLAFHKNGIIPDISIVDFRTRRSEKENYKVELQSIRLGSSGSGIPRAG